MWLAEREEKGGDTGENKQGKQESGGKAARVGVDEWPRVCGGRGQWPGLSIL